MATLNTGSLGAVAAATAALSTQKLITLCVTPSSGDNAKYKVAIEVTLDGTIWVELPYTAINYGCISVDLVAVGARAKVFVAEPTTSEANVTILAR